MDGVNSSSNEIAHLYHVLPINKSGSQTRVLEILPGRENDDIEVRIRTIDISLNPNYEALSYTWSKATEGRSILVQGRCRVDVTDNLYNALFYMRRRHRRRILWVDQICINQADTNERSQQVGIMGSIYKSAQCVNVWLGKAERPPPSDFGTNLAKMFKYWIRHGFTRSWTIVDKLDWMRYRLKDVVSPQSYIEYWDACRNLPAVIKQAIDVREPCWLDRVWMVQEFALGREVYFWCGSTSFRYYGKRLHSLRGIYNLEIPPRFEERVSRQMYDTFRKPYQALEKQLKQGIEPHCFSRIDVWKISLWAPGFSAKYDIDMILGFLGMLSNEEAAYIRSDYQMSAAEAFARAIYASIRYRSSFQILRYTTKEPVTRELPSWSLDFACPHDRRRTRWPPDSEPFSAFVRQNAQAGPELTTLDEINRLLTITAAPLGTVVASLPLWAENHSSQLSSPELWEFVREAIVLLDQRDCTECWEGFRKALDLHKSRPACQEPSQKDRSEFCESIDKPFVDAYGEYRTKTSWDGGYRQNHARCDILSAVFNLFAKLSGMMYATHRTDPLLDPSYSKFFSHPMNQKVYSEISANLVVTSSGLIGIAPGSVRNGDTLVLFASSYPFVALRQTGDWYEFCEHVWVWAIPFEEVVDKWYHLKFVWKEYVLC